MYVVPTLMSVSPPGWMKLTKGPQDLTDIDDLNFWHNSAMKYVKKVVDRYSSSPVLHSWILWNEPLRNITEGEHSIPAFRDFLKKKYCNDIENLNRKYYRQYKCFDEVSLQNNKYTISLPFCSFAEKTDWIYFTIANLIQKLQDIAAEIRKIDKAHPVHVNPAGIGENYMDAGQSIWKEADIVDFLGCSAHPPWHSARFPQDRLHQSVAYFADMIKSATPHPEKLFWVTELQGGPTILSSPTYSCPTGKDIEHWLWESIGAGARAVVFWCFNARNDGAEGGEWSLLDWIGQPSARLKAAKKVADIIEKNRKIFDESRPAPANVTMLCSETSWLLGDMEGKGYEVSNPRNRQMGADALCGAYLMFSDSGLDVNIVDERKLKDGLWMNNCKVLVLPGVTALESDAISAIGQFVSSGGIVIADGLCGMKDEDGRISEFNQRKLSEIFGMNVEGIEGVPANFRIIYESGDKGFPGWFVRVIPQILQGKCIAQFEDGREAVVLNRLGEGMGIRIGTAFFQRYLSKPDNEHIEFLSNILPEDLYSGRLRLLNSSSHLRIKRLLHTDGEVLIILNRGGETTARLKAGCEGKLESIDGKISMEFSPGTINIDMCAEEVKMFRWTAKK